MTENEEGDIDLSASTAPTIRRTSTDMSGSSEPIDVRAIRRKLRVQLGALDLLETLLLDLLTRGLGTHGDERAKTLRRNAAALRRGHLPGAELALLRLSDHLRRGGSAPRRGDGRDADSTAHHRALDELVRLDAMLRHGRRYLAERIDDPTLSPATDTAIAAWLGHVWRYEELEAVGCGEPAAELMQLAFFVEDDRVSREHIDTGVWIHLADGRLFHTENRRPRSAKRVRFDGDFGVAAVSGFVRYPGGAPTRACWRESTAREIEPADHERVRELAATDFAATLRAVRNDMRSPLGPRHRLALLRPARSGCIPYGRAERFAIEDASGTRIELADPPDPVLDVPATADLMRIVGHRTDDSAVLGLFHLDLDTHRLALQPIAFVLAGSMARTAY